MEHCTTESNFGDNNYNETKNTVGNNFIREGKALNGNNRYLKRLMKSKSVCNLNFKELERRMTSSCSNLKTFEEEEAMSQPYRRKKSVTFDEPQIQGVLNYPAEPKNSSFLKGDKMKTFNKMLQKTLSIGKIKTYTKKNLLKKMNSSYNDSNKNYDNDDPTEESLNRTSVGLKDHHLNPDKLNRNISSSMPDLKSDFVVYRTPNYDNDNDMNSVRSISSTGTNTTSKIKNMAVLNVKKIKNFHPKNTVKALRKAVYKPKDQRLRNTFPSRSYDDILRENNYPTQAEYLFDNSKDEQYECGNFDDDEQYYNIRRTSAFSSTVDDKNIDEQSLQKRCSTIEEEINKIIEDSKNIKKDKENENHRMSNFIPKIEIISPEAPVVETVSEGSRESFSKTDTLSDRNYRRKKIRQKGTKLKRNTNSTNSSCSSFEERKFFQSLHKIVTQTSSASSSEGKANAKEIAKNQSDDKIYVSGPTRENDLPPTGSPQSYSLIKKVQKLHARVNLFRSVSDFGPLPSTPPPPKPPRSYKLIEKKDSLSRPTDIDAGFRRYSLVDTDYGYLSSYSTRSMKKETSYTFASRPIYDTQSSDENSCTYKRFSWNSSSDESSHYDFIERASSFGDDNYLEGNKKSTSPLLDNSEEEWGHCTTSNGSSTQYLDAQYLTPPSSPYIRKDIRKMALQRSQNSSSLNTLNISESPKDIVLLKRSISDVTSQNNSKTQDGNEEDTEKTETFKLNEEKEIDPLSRKDKVVLGLFFQKLIEKENELKSGLSTSIAEEGSVAIYNDNKNFNELNSKDVSDSNNNDKGECETLDSAERTSFENEENHGDENFEASCTPPLYGIVMNNEMGLELFWPIRRNNTRKNSGWTSEPEIGSTPKDFRSNRRFSSSAEYISSENDSMMTRAGLTPKEKCLVQKNSSLSTEVSLLQRHCKNLSKENLSLKRKMDVELDRPGERIEMEKERQKQLHQLKKKNYELSNITRKLEEKVKNLEKKTKESPSSDRHSIFLMKQREKEAEYERQINERDVEIDKLKQRMKDLVRKLTGKNGEITQAQSTQELEHIIRTVTKERLQLERHLAISNEGLLRAQEVESEKGSNLTSFQSRNSTLRQQLGDLNILTKQHHTLEKHVREKNLECVTLKEKLKLKSELCHDLESQLAKVIEKNTELTIQNSDLQKQIQELQHVNVSEECRSLKQSLVQGAPNWPPTSVDQKVSQSLPANLESSIRLDNVYGTSEGPRGRGETSLEHVLIQMKDAADRRKELEKQHAEALSQLREKQAALEGAIGRHGSYADKKAYSETIEALQSKIRELEKKAEVQSLRHEELLLEMQSLKKTHSSPKNSWSRSGSLSAELPSPESGDITPDSSQILSNGSTARSTPVPHYGMGLGPSHYAFDVMGLAEFSDSILSNPPYSTSPLTGQAGVSQFNSLSSGIFTATTSTFSTAGDHGVSTHTAQNISVNSEIDRIMAKIQQDNKILAELDKSRSTIGVATSACNSSFTSSTLNALSNMSSSSFRTGGTNFSNIFTTPLTSTATTVAALDLSQPLTNPLINTFTNPIDSLLDPNLSHPSLGLGGISGSSSTGFTGSNFLTNPLGNSSGVLGGGASGSGGGLAGLDLGGVGGLNLVNPVTGTFLGGGGTSTFPTAASLPTIITTLYDKDDKNIVNGNLSGVLLPPGLETDNRVLDVLEIPGKGRCHVYIARYSYDPFQQSPNENPEAELALNAGDYVLVWGHMDEDGFFDGELLDGRRGLVPSNFVEKLVGDDLIEFHQSIVIGLRDCDESVSTSVPQDLDFISQDDSQFLMEFGLNQQRIGTASHCTYLDLEDIAEEEESPLGDNVPPPVQLTLERQLNKSILIGWNPPPDCPPGTIESYHVYVNGLLKTTVKANERTRALVEGVDSTKLHRISVRSVTPNRRTSRDAACTMVIGKDCPVGPTSVRATNITSTSAVISWMPSNSNFQHTVCVNSVEVRTVKPGVYRHTITGLSPNTIYRVSIRAKNLRAPQFDEKSSLFQERLSAGIEFRTLPKGLPDPPVDVQVEIGPQDGSLLVTWLPVTLNSSSGTSNGALVTGYAVYADGKKVTEVDSPTGDHALIDLNKIHGFEPRQITVRTKSRESVSSDSVPTLIPSHFIRSRGKKLLESEEVLYSDYERIAELSDIAEESETELSDNDLQGDHKTAQGTTHRQGPLPQAPAAGPRGLKDRLLGRRAPPVPGARTDHLGQTILEHEDNLSDKEIYPGQGVPPHQGPAHHPHQQQQPASSIPSIEITKDTPSGMDPHYDGYPEDEYDMGRGRYDSRHPPPRGRQPPVPNPHRQPPRDPRDLRDPRDMRDPRADPRDYRDSHGPHSRDRRDPRDMRDSRDYRDPSDSRDRYDDTRHRGQDYGRGRPGEHPRIFVALFDYDPPTMSPNPDACDEELGFREGQLIKVFGDKDPDGFYWGEASGRGGYVPCNMVSEVQVDDERVAQELLKESEAGRRRRDGSVGRRGHAGDRWGDIYANMPVRKMIAMYDYDPQELSPNVDSEVELSFQTGDIIYVYGDMDDDGFYMGELRGQRGLVPSNFLQDAPHDYDEHRSRRDTLDPRDRPLHGGRGHGPGVHGPPPPPRPDQRDKRRDPRSVASRSVTSAQDTRGVPSDNPVGPRQDPAGSSSTHGQERNGRSVSRERGRSATRTNNNPGSTTMSTSAAAGRKFNEMDLMDDEAETMPGISSADLDQLMEDFDLNDPLDDYSSTAATTTATTITTTTTTTTAANSNTTDSKLGGLAGALPGGIGAGLSSGLSSLSNPMGKLGEMATQNPVTGAMSKGKDFLFKKFGL